LLVTSPLWLRVDGGAEGVYPVKALALQGAHIIAKEGKHQSLLGLEYLQAAEQKNACDPIANGQNQQRDAQKQPVVLQQQDAANEQSNGCRIAQQGEQQYRHAVFAGVQNFLFHNSSLLMGSEVFLFDTKIISLCRTAVKRGTQKRTRPSVKWTGRPFVYGEKWRNIV